MMAAAGGTQFPMRRSPGKTSTSVPLPRGGSWRRALVYWGPVAAVGALIVAVSSIPGARLDFQLIRHADKLAHLSIFGVLGLLLLRAMARTTRLAPAARVVVAVALVAAFGVTDELHQMLVPGRTAEVADVAADATGALLGCLLFWAGGRLARWRAGRRAS